MESKHLYFTQDSPRGGRGIYISFPKLKCEWDLCRPGKLNPNEVQIFLVVLTDGRVPENCAQGVEREWRLGSGPSKAGRNPYLRFRYGHKEGLCMKVHFELGFLMIKTCN